MVRLSEYNEDWIDQMLDSSGTVQSGLSPGIIVDKSISRCIRRIDRKPRLDEYDEMPIETEEEF